MKAKVKVPASLGEFIQGKIYGREMLVSCPINLYSISEVEICWNYGINPYYEKIYKALDIFLKRYKIKGINASDIKVKTHSDIARSKGLASSTADITSSLAALSRIVNITLSSKDIASMAIEVEATDSIIFKDITLFDHLYGEKIETIAPAFYMEILLLEGKNTIDTIDFRRDKNYIKLVANMDEQYKKLKKALVNKDINLLGQICTESAFANQKLLYKTYLEDLYDIATGCKSPGIIIAHSGTVSGVIINDETDKDKLFHFIRKSLKNHFENIYFTHTVKGGYI